MKSPAARPSTSAVRVLVVDDNEDAVDLLVMLLQMEGMDAHGCTRAPDAPQLVQRLQPDVVVTDVHMPGLGGVALARQLRAQHPSLRLVALTGEDGMADRVVGGPFDHVMAKPVDVEALVTLLHTEMR